VESMVGSMHKVYLSIEECQDRFVVEGLHQNKGVGSIEDFSSVD
jgi:hypothetical protein